MNVLLIGSGAREHTIAWKLRQSPRLDDLLVAPGSSWTEGLGTNLGLAIDDQDALVRAARDHHVDLVVVGNEEPLAAGLIDRLAVEGIAAFGPSRQAAEIESSKRFAKELMGRHRIATAPFAVFDDAGAARAYVEQQDGPLVVKADGLAKGKGVLVTGSRDEALQAVASVMERRDFGSAGDRTVIERRLYGREVSAHAFTDGRAVAHMPFSCDHKPIFDGDRGPNTGGMGAYSPALWLDDSSAQAIRSDVTEAAVRAMAEEGRPYRGVLYPGLMITEAGPSVIEFNCRFGDPEAQVVLPRMESDLLDVLWAVANNKLDEVDIRWSQDACVGVVLASGGYPGPYETGLPIEGLADIEPDVHVFHAGTRRDDAGATLTAGGRVLTVVASGASLEEARRKAYRNVERISFQGMHYRRDIGLVDGNETG
ncbi:MAG: phosphoribosylamine--glycine ligase [Chloroflexi bacterium]|nr:phosphoribosylamine--glycine ligase [Chloroflexota bacterium]